MTNPSYEIVANDGHRVTIAETRTTTRFITMPLNEAIELANPYQLGNLWLAHLKAGKIVSSHMPAAGSAA